MAKQRRNAEAPAGPERLSLREFIALLLGFPAQAANYHARLPPPRTGDADVDADARLAYKFYTEARRRYQEDPDKFLVVLQEVAGLGGLAAPVSKHRLRRPLDPVEDPRLWESQKRFMLEAGKNWRDFLHTEGLRDVVERQPLSGEGPRPPRGFEIHPVVVEPGTKAELAAMVQGIKAGFAAAERVRAGRTPGAPLPQDLNVALPPGMPSGGPEAFYHQQGVARGKLQWNPGEVQLLVERAQKEFDLVSKASQEWFTRLKTMAADRASLLEGYAKWRMRVEAENDAQEDTPAVRQAAIERFMATRGVSQVEAARLAKAEETRLPSQGEETDAETLKLLEAVQQLTGSARRDPALHFMQRIGVSLGRPSSYNSTATTTKYRTTDKISPALLGLPVPLDKNNRPLHRTCWLIIQDGRVVDVATGLGGRFGVRKMIRAYNQVWWAQQGGKVPRTKASKYENTLVRIRKLTEQARELSAGLYPVAESQFHGTRIAAVKEIYEALSAEDQARFVAAADILNSAASNSQLAAELARVTKERKANSQQLGYLRTAHDELSKTVKRLAGKQQDAARVGVALDKIKQAKAAQVEAAAAQRMITLDDLQREYERVLAEVDDAGKLKFQRWTVNEWVPGLRRGQSSLNVNKRDLPGVLLGYTQDFVQAFLVEAYNFASREASRLAAKMLEGMTLPQQAALLVQARLPTTLRDVRTRREREQSARMAVLADPAATAAAREIAARDSKFVGAQLALADAGLGGFRWTFTPERGLFAGISGPELVEPQVQAKIVPAVVVAAADAGAQAEYDLDQARAGYDLDQARAELAQTAVEMETREEAGGQLRATWDSLRKALAGDSESVLGRAEAVFHLKHELIPATKGHPEEMVRWVSSDAPPSVVAAYNMLVRVDIDSKRMTPIEYLQAAYAQASQEEAARAVPAADAETNPAAVARKAREDAYQKVLQALAKNRRALKAQLSEALVDYAAQALTPDGQLRAPSGLVKKRLKQLFTAQVLSALTDDSSIREKLCQGTPEYTREFLEAVLNDVVASGSLTKGEATIREQSFDEVLDLLVGFFTQPLTAWARGTTEINEVLAAVPVATTKLTDFTLRIRPRIEKLLAQQQKGDEYLEVLIRAMSELVCGLLPVWLPVPMGGQSRVIALEASSFFGWGTSAEDAPYIWYPGYNPVSAAGRLQLFLESTTLSFFRTSGDIPVEGRASGRAAINWIHCYPDTVAISQVQIPGEPGQRPRPKAGYYTSDYIVDADAVDEFEDEEFEMLLKSEEASPDFQSEDVPGEVVLETVVRPNEVDAGFFDDGVFTIPVTPFMVEDTRSLFLTTCKAVRRSFQHRFGAKRNHRYNIYVALGVFGRPSFQVAGLQPVKARVPLTKIKPGKLTLDAIRSALVEKFITETSRPAPEAELEASRHLNAPAYTEVLTASPYVAEMARTGFDPDYFPALGEFDPADVPWGEIRHALQMPAPAAASGQPITVGEVYTRYLAVPAERALDVVPLVALKRAVFDRLTSLYKASATPKWWPSAPGNAAKPAARVVRAVTKAGGPKLVFAVEPPRTTTKNTLAPRVLGPGAVILHAIGTLGARFLLQTPDNYLGLFRACLVEAVEHKLRSKSESREYSPWAIPNESAVPVLLEGDADDTRLWVQSESDTLFDEFGAGRGRRATVQDVIEGNAAYSDQDPAQIAEYTDALRVLLEKLDASVDRRLDRLGHLDEAGTILLESQRGRTALLGFLVGTTRSTSDTSDKEGRVVVPYGFLVRVGLKRLNLAEPPGRRGLSTAVLAKALEQGLRDFGVHIAAARTDLGRRAWEQWQVAAQQAKPEYIGKLEEITPEVLDRWLVVQAGPEPVAPQLSDAAQEALMQVARTNPGQSGRRIGVLNIPPLVMWATMLYAPRTGTADHRLQQGLGRGTQALNDYGALDPSGRLTPVGHQMFQDIAQGPLEDSVQWFLEMVAEARLQRRIPGAIRENHRGVLLSGETPLTRTAVVTETGAQVDAVLLRPRVPVEVKQADGTVVTYETRPRIWVPVDQVEDVRSRWPELRRGVAARVVQNVAGFNQELLGWAPPAPDGVEPRYLNQEVVAERRLRLANTKPAEGKNYPRVVAVKPKYRKEDPKDPDPWRGKLGPGVYQAPTPGNPRGRAQRIRQARTTARQVAAFGYYPGVGGGGGGPVGPQGPKGGSRGSKGSGQSGVVPLGPQVPPGQGPGPKPSVVKPMPAGSQELLSQWVASANELFVGPESIPRDSVLGLMYQPLDLSTLAQAGDVKQALGAAGGYNALFDTVVQPVADRLYKDAGLKGFWRVLKLYADVYELQPWLGQKLLTLSTAMWERILSNVPDQPYTVEDRAWALHHSVLPVLAGKPGTKVTGTTTAAAAAARTKAKAAATQAREAAQEEAYATRQDAAIQKVERIAGVSAELQPEVAPPVEASPAQAPGRVSRRPAADAVAAVAAAPTPAMQAAVTTLKEYLATEADPPSLANQAGRDVVISLLDPALTLVEKTAVIALVRESLKPPKR